MKSKRRATPSESNSSDDSTANGNAKIAGGVSSLKRSPKVVSGQRMKTTPPQIASSPRDTANITRNKVFKDKGPLSGKKDSFALAKTSGKLGSKKSTGENVSREMASPKGRSVAARVKGISNHGASSNAKNSKVVQKEKDEESDTSDRQAESDADEMAASGDEFEEISVDQRSKSSSTGRNPMGKSRARGLEEEEEDSDDESDEEQDLDGEESEQDLQSFMQAFPGMSSDEDEKEEDEVKMEEDGDDQHDESDSDQEEEDEDEEDGSGLMKASSSHSIVLVRRSIS